MKLSFGMIFSIILIIFFIAFAFYAIQKFLEIQNAAKIGQFSNKLQSDVDKMWRGSQGSQSIEYFLPSKIEKVCFVDFFSNSKGEYQNLYDKLKQVYYEYENLFFYPVGSGAGIDALEIKHIDIEKITENENPFCIKNAKGKIKMTIKKNYDEALVVISR